LSLAYNNTNKIITPPFLKEGDKVAIVSPAGKVKREIIEQGINVLQQQGFKVVVGEHAYNSYSVFAGTDPDRAGDLQKVLDNDEIRAVFFSRGGYGSIRTLQLIDWERFLKNPKWLVGFSDITVFHSFLFSNNIVSLHGVMPSFFKQNDELTDSFELTINLLKGILPKYNVNQHPLNTYGTVKGNLVGGNISVLMSLRGTSLDILNKGGILFIEDIGEYYYHLDRIMMNFKTGNILQNMSGLIVGHFTDMKTSNSDYGKTAYEIIHDAVKEYDYPVVFGFPAGHELPNYPLLMGGKVEVDVTREGCNINCDL
jgi:muramoyltetrapeptide carboxypeptidase